jgi:acetyltransferase
MKLMIAHAIEEGLSRVEGQVLAENHKMLGMCEQLGFHIRDERDDPGVKLVSLDVAAMRRAETVPLKRLE